MVRAGAVDIVKKFKSVRCVDLLSRPLFEDHIAEAILTNAILEFLLLLGGQIVPIRMVAVEHAAGLEGLSGSGDVERVHLDVNGERHLDWHYEERACGLGGSDRKSGGYFVAWMEPANLLDEWDKLLLLLHPACRSTIFVGFLDRENSFDLACHVVGKALKDIFNLSER